MAFCNVKNPPEYTAEIRKWDRETRADGQGMAVEIEQLFNNTYYNKETKVDKSGGDISGTMVTADEISEKFPVPAAGEETRTFFGKVKKSMEDWKNFKNGIITLGMLSNQHINSTDKIPTSALVYTLKQSIDQMDSSLNNPSAAEIYQIPDIKGVSSQPAYIDNGFHNVTKYSNGIRIYSIQVYVYTSAVNDSIIGFIDPKFMGINQDLYGYAVDVKTDRLFLIQIQPNGTIMLKTLGGSAIPEQALNVRGSVVY